MVVQLQTIAYIKRTSDGVNFSFYRDIPNDGVPVFVNDLSKAFKFSDSLKAQKKMDDIVFCEKKNSTNKIVKDTIVL